MTTFVSCGGGGLPPGASGPSTPITVTVSPLTAIVAIGSTRQFTATVTGGDASQKGVVWSLTGPGTISSTGLYTAPLALPATTAFQVRATSTHDSTKFGIASVTLSGGSLPGQFPVFFDVRTRNNRQVPVAPTTVGIPLPPGLHSDSGTLRIQPAAGSSSVPAQFEVLSRWNDGSIRWLLCDFMADLSPAGGVGKYRLHDGGLGTAPTSSLNVTDGATAITVNTGVLNFRVSKSAFRLFESVQIDRDGNTIVNDECLDTAALKGIAFVDGADEYLMNNSVPTRVQIEQSGPIRATILIEGEHRTAGGARLLDFICRITAWTDLPYIRVQYSFKNTDHDGVPTATPADAAAQLASFRTADALHVDLPIDFSGIPPAALIGGVPLGTTISAMSAAEHAELLQTYVGTHDNTDLENPQPPGFDPGTGDGSSVPLENVWPDQDISQIIYNVTGKATDSGERAPGWVQMTGADIRVTAAVRDFWQMYPKSLRVQGDGLMRLGLWPSGTWPLQVFAGSMRTHELVFGFEAANALNAVQARLIAGVVQDPPVGICRPEHYRASQVFGAMGVTTETLSDTSLFIASAQPWIADYFAEVLAHMGDLLADRNSGNGTAIGHEYGFWNWGDGKTDTPSTGWENAQWELPRACLGWYAMTGNLNFFALADESIRHFRDVDVLHSDIGWRFDYAEPGNPAVSGGKASQRGKTRYTPNNKQHDLGNYNSGGAHLDVLKGAFLAEHYLLTGDRLSLDVLKEVFTYLRGTWKGHFDPINGGIDSTMTAPVTWLANGLYIAAAYRMANGLNDTAASPMASFARTVVHNRQIGVTPRDPSGNGFADSNGDFTAWHVGHLAEAMEYSIHAIEDNTLQPAVLNAMNWMLGSNAGVYLGHLPAPIFGGFAESPGGTTNFGGANLMIGAGYAAAYRESGTGNWHAAAINLLSVQLPEIELAVVGSDGVRHSTFAQYFRAGPMLLGALMQ